VVCAGGLALLLIEMVLAQTAVPEAAMRFRTSQPLWLLLVIPPVLAVFFWWSARVAKIAGAICRALACCRN
jgi:hypothetical protein